ncbi:hypothetical protein AXG93_1713s1020 [Marchantia polymorpha subsp. ruderalis]|uniref:Uncharacterized protein n=1 Tax=Marchantia polymorpha subsp. ruderalis TaxID=1480154 RepID=A0A176VSJ3_MARPO|nr:hypothetical protein AXG93_1713s1020 [Marchantia polymorpha subsp. ruderalis]
MGSNSSNTIRVVERAVREESDFFFFFSLPRVDGLFFFQFLPRAHGERNHWQPDSLIDEETRLDVTALGSGGLCSSQPPALTSEREPKCRGGGGGGFFGRPAQRSAVGSMGRNWSGAQALRYSRSVLVHQESGGNYSTADSCLETSCDSSSRS